MPKIGASELLYQQILLAYKAPFYDATHRLPNSYRPVAAGPHRETESHTAFRSSNCEMRLMRRGAAGTGSSVTDRRAEVRISVCAAPRGSRSVPRRGQRAAPGHAWQLLPSAERLPGPPARSVPFCGSSPLPNNDPASPIPPEAPFPPSPGTRSGV